MVLHKYLVRVCMYNYELTQKLLVAGQVHTPLDLTEDEWNELIKTNLSGTWVVSKYVGRQMREGGEGGSIINISSIAGLERGQLPGGLAYAASKTAVNAMTKVIHLGSITTFLIIELTLWHAGDGLGVRGVQNKSELYFSWTIQVGDNTRPNAEGLA